MGKWGQKKPPLEVSGGGSSGKLECPSIGGRGIWDIGSLFSGGFVGWGSLGMVQYFCGNRWLFGSAFKLSGRKFLKGSSYGICITPLKENKPLRWLFRAVLCQSEVNAIFSGNRFKCLDILVADFDIGNANALMGKLFYSLLALAVHVFGLCNLFTFIKKGFHGFGKEFCGQFAALNNQGNIFLAYLVICRYVLNLQSLSFGLSPLRE